MRELGGVCGGGEAGTLVRHEVGWAVRTQRLLAIGAGVSASVCRRRMRCFAAHGQIAGRRVRRTGSKNRDYVMKETRT